MTTKTTAKNEKGQTGPRVIKKYANRRLYDTVESSYVALADLKALVIKNEDFVVTDHNGEDITRQMLAMIILGDDSGGAPFSKESLAGIIQSNQAAPKSLSSWMDESIRTYSELQALIRKRSLSLGMGPASLGGEILSAMMELQSKASRDLLSAWAEECSKITDKAFSKK